MTQTDMGFTWACPPLPHFTCTIEAASSAARDRRGMAVGFMFYACHLSVASVGNSVLRAVVSNGPFRSLLEQDPEFCSLDMARGTQHA